MNFLGKDLSAGLFLAPMAGVTDFAFRTVCARSGADVTVTEMVSSRALVYGDRKSRSLLRRNEEGLCGAQIFGNDPAMMAEAAEIALEWSHCDFIDINMGCPMPKIANNGDGSALMKNPELACAIVKAVAQRVAVPVTVKTRTGWDKGSVNIVSFSKALADSGASAIAIHGRTRTMLYSGRADWDIIGKVSAALEIPVIANGDIVDPESALRCAERCGTPLLMVGRAAFGDPWLFGQLADALQGRPVQQRPALEERMDVALAQFNLSLEDKGSHIACLEARKHLAWYLRGVSHSSFYKEQISHLSSPEEVYGVVKAIKRDLR